MVNIARSWSKRCNSRRTFGLKTFPLTQIFGSLLLVVYGRQSPLLVPEDASTYSLNDGQAQLGQMSSTLLQEMKDAIRILTGDTEALFGTIGRDASRFFYTVLPSHFDELLQELGKVEFGSSRTHSPKATYSEG